MSLNVVLMYNSFTVFIRSITFSMSEIGKCNIQMWFHVCWMPQLQFLLICPVLVAQPRVSEGLHDPPICSSGCGLNCCTGFTRHTTTPQSGPLTSLGWTGPISCSSAKDSLYPLTPEYLLLVTIVYLGILILNQSSKHIDRKWSEIKLWKTFYALNLKSLNHNRTKHL